LEASGNGPVRTKNQSPSRLGNGSSGKVKKLVHTGSGTVNYELDFDRKETGGGAAGRRRNSLAGTPHRRKRR